MGKMKLDSEKSGAKRAKSSKKSNKSKKILLIVLGILVLGAAAFFIWKVFLGSDVKTDKPEAKSPEVVEPVRYYSPLTGREISDPAIANRPVMAVMIENSPEARPQSGLKDAGVVFEAIAEGGITRFVALYQEAEPSSVGPVRSARPYYLEWAVAFDPAFVHVGGSEKALQMLVSGKYGLNIDEAIKDDPIFRVRDRAAPHNAYTNYDKLSVFVKNKGKTTSGFTGWARQDGKAQDCPPCADGANCEECAASAARVNMEISSGAFNVSYDWDKDTNTYKRNVGGKPHNDREQGQISPDVVIALRSNWSQDGIYSIYQTTGTNDCYIFQNGTVIEGKWSRDDTKSMLKFTDKSGNEIKLNRGQTWLTAVGQNRKVTWE